MHEMSVFLCAILWGLIAHFGSELIEEFRQPKKSKEIQPENKYKWHPVHSIRDLPNNYRPVLIQLKHKKKYEITKFCVCYIVGEPRPECKFTNLGNKWHEIEAWTELPPMFEDEKDNSHGK